MAITHVPGTIFKKRWKILIWLILLLLIIGNMLQSIDI